MSSCLTLIISILLLISHALPTKTWYYNSTLGIAYLYHDECIKWNRTNAESLCINVYNATSVISIPTSHHWTFMNSIIDIRPSGDCSYWSDEGWIAVGADTMDTTQCDLHEKAGAYKWWNGDAYDMNAFPWRANDPSHDCSNAFGMHFSFELRRMADTGFWPWSDDKYATLCQKIIAQNSPITTSSTTTSSIITSSIINSSITINPGEKNDDELFFLLIIGIVVLALMVIGLIGYIVVRTRRSSIMNQEINKAISVSDDAKKPVNMNENGDKNRDSSEDMYINKDNANACNFETNVTETEQQDLAYTAEGAGEV